MAWHTEPALGRPDLVSDSVSAVLSARPAQAAAVRVGAIDPALADTAAFTAAYGVAPDASANCLVVVLRRAERTWYAACVVLATTRADVNGLVRRRLDARKASFASMPDAVELTGMEYGGITPLGLPAGWPVLIDAQVAVHPEVVVGSGLRASKLVLPGEVLLALSGGEVVTGLGLPVRPGG